MKKRLVSLLLALALVLPAMLTPASAAAGQASFPDVQPGEWFHPYVMQLAQAGGVHGYVDGTFRPLTPIARSEVATIAVNLFPPDQYLNDYCPDDVMQLYADEVDKRLAPDYWAKDTVLKTSLCLDGLKYVSWKWDEPATRSDIALILTSVYIGHMYGLGKLELPLSIPVPEEAELLIGDYASFKGTEAEEPVLWLYNEGIITGVNERRDFNPQATATRAECCKIAVNLMDPSKRDTVDWDAILSEGNTGGGTYRYEKDFTGKDRVRYANDVAFDYCRALEEQIGIQIFYMPDEWTEKADGLISPDEAIQVINGNGLDHFFPAVLTELQKMKAAFDKYPDGFLKEMARKKGSRTAEIILCPYTFEGMTFYGRYVYDYSSDAKKVDQVYYTGVGDTHSYSHEMGHMVTSAVGILNGWNTTCSTWDKMMTGDWDSYISGYATTSRPEDQAETWAYMWEQPQTVVAACSNAGLKAKVQYLTQILDKHYSTFHADQAPWAAALK